MIDPKTQHHMWCNHLMRPREGCTMCDGPKGLWAMYPYDETDQDGLMKKHFPENVEIR